MKLYTSKKLLLNCWRRRRDRLMREVANGKNPKREWWQRMKGRIEAYDAVISELECWQVKALEQAKPKRRSK